GPSRAPGRALQRCRAGSAGRGRSSGQEPGRSAPSPGSLGASFARLRMSGGLASRGPLVPSLSKGHPELVEGCRAWPGHARFRAGAAFLAGAFFFEGALRAVGFLAAVFFAPPPLPWLPTDFFSAAIRSITLSPLGRSGSSTSSRIFLPLAFCF